MEMVLSIVFLVVVQMMQRRSKNRQPNNVYGAVKLPFCQFHWICDCEKFRSFVWIVLQLKFKHINMRAHRIGTNPTERNKYRVKSQLEICRCRCRQRSFWCRESLLPPSSFIGDYKTKRLNMKRNIFSVNKNEKERLSRWSASTHFDIF